MFFFFLFVGVLCWFFVGFYGVVLGFLGFRTRFLGFLRPSSGVVCVFWFWGWVGGWGGGGGGVVGGGGGVLWGRIRWRWWEGGLWGYCQGQGVRTDAPRTAAPRLGGGHVRWNLSFFVWGVFF